MAAKGDFNGFSATFSLQFAASIGDSFACRRWFTVSELHFIRWLRYV